MNQTPSYRDIDKPCYPCGGTGQGKDGCCKNCGGKGWVRIYVQVPRHRCAIQKHEHRTIPG